MSRLAPETPELVWFSGPDAVGFLEDIISQQVAGMQPGEVRRSLLLGARGKLDHILWVLRGEELVGLMTDAGRGEELASTLNRYRIRVKVTIEVEPRALWVVLGEEVEPSSWTPKREGPLDAGVSWVGVPRRLVAGERPGLEPVAPSDYELARIMAGEPRWAVDVDEGTIPQETELVGLMVDFDKGCYLGQELVARIHSRGHVNRFLRILELEGSAAAGSVLTWEGRDVGVMTSVSDGYGLGLVRREVVPGSRVTMNGVGALVRAVPAAMSPAAGRG
ncbi:MAG: hypothetical protein L0Z47_09695 [Actinobacteria bacterium]|nr:hypothetical protein [Actinomycetota bacterium]